MKKVLRILGRVILMLFALFAVVYVFGRVLSARYTSENYDPGKPAMQSHIRSYDSTAINYDSLERIYGQRKIIPNKYRKQILVALSHYPELVNTKVDFSVIPTLIPVASRPEPSTVFNSREERTYNVIISSAAPEGMEEQMGPALLKNMTFNSQVGAIGHELGHTVYYHDKSSTRLIGLLLAYPFNKFRAKFERETDRRAIDHGLGWQIHDWAAEIRPEGYDSEFLDTYYMTPEEIREYMESSQ